MQERLPEHKREVYEFKSNKGAQWWTDQYKYLDGIDNDSPSSQLTKTKKFEFEEKLYTQISFMTQIRLEDRLASDILKRQSFYNQVPLVYEEYTYMGKEGAPIHDLYRIRGNQDEGVEEELVLEQTEVITRLKQISIMEEQVDRLMF